MAEEIVPINKRCCQAMLDAGIDDPESTEGILFCTGSRDDVVKSQCPYNYCVVVEYMETVAQLRKGQRTKLIRSMSGYGISREDIALIVKVSATTVRRTLRV